MSSTYGSLRKYYDHPPLKIDSYRTSVIVSGLLVNQGHVEDDELLSDMTLVCYNYYGMQESDWFVVKVSLASVRPSETLTSFIAYARGNTVGGLAVQTDDRGSLIPWFWFELESDAICFSMAMNSRAR